MNKRIIVVPLDSRPCNTSWITDLAAVAKTEVLMYPREQCGSLLVGSDRDKIFKWLDQTIQDNDYLIISADGLCSGGLVQGRLGVINLEETIISMNALKKYKIKFPNLKIFVFDTLMRTTITSLNQESINYSGKMNEFSRLTGRVYFFDKQEDKLQLEQLQNEIPSHIITPFLRGRRIKHELNKTFIELVNESVIDFLIILQEDSMPHGVQQMEQDIIIKMIDKMQIKDKIKFYNGTDEGGAVLLGKVILDEYKLTPKIFVHLPLENSLNKIMLFEDQPFDYNLDNMLDTIGFIKTNSVEEADFILSIYTEQRNVNLQINTTEEVLPLRNDVYWNFINELNTFLKAGKKVAFVDLLFPNGGSIDILKDIDFNLLSSYSAWNTASNALGTCLCEVASLIANPDHKGKKFLYERLLDDCIYQYIVRRIVNQKYIKRGINVYNLEEHGKEVLEEIKKEMKNYDSLIGNFNYKISLPWNRTFESEIIIEE
jgi:hypothetical protein